MLIEIQRKLNLPLVISADQIELPTGGAKITKCTLLHEGETFQILNPFIQGVYEKVSVPADIYRYEGVIHPIDPEAPDICFEAGLPLEWNGKVIQQGGGGLDGFVPCCFSNLTGQSTELCALKQGYAVIGSDSGHKDIYGNSMSADFAINRESFENYAHLALKKVRDIAVILSELVYGVKPQRIYFFGGSNGGRETMKAIQNYPEDYDGAICFYPVLYWIQKVLMDARNELVMQKNGAAAMIDQETDARIMDTVHEICGAKDGLIDDIAAAERKRPEVKHVLRTRISPKQLEVMKALSEPYSMSYPLAFGEWTLPGYPVFEGTSPLTQCTLMTTAQSHGIRTGTESAVANIIMQDPQYDLFANGMPDLMKFRERFLELSVWLDACNTDLDSFVDKGGRMILIQGTTDPQVTMYGTVQYVEN